MMPELIVITIGLTISGILIYKGYQADKVEAKRKAFREEQERCFLDAYDGFDDLDSALNLLNTKSLDSNRD